MAYQGRFDAKNQGQFPTASERAAQKKAAAQAQTPRRASTPAAQPAAAQQNVRTPAAQPVRNYTPQQPPKRKGPRTGTVIFYTIYFLLIIGFFGGIFFITDWLEGWLTDYEAAQPTTKCQEVFEELFGDPDWADLYDRAGIEDTTYEGKDSFVAYMDAKLGDSKLTYQETSAGLSGDKKYFVKLEDETIGYFTLVGDKEYITDIPDWELGEVGLYYAYKESVTVELMDGQTAYINGVPLDDTHTIQIGTTLAENYLPDGLHGPRIYTQHLTGLMQEPVVTVTDAAGNNVEVSYNAETDTYVAQTAVNTPSDDQKTLATNTAKAYSLRMINQNHQMGKYFDTTSESYQAIIGTATFMQTWFYRSHEFGETTFSGYYRYSDNLFSIHVELPMYVTRTDGTVREYNVDHTFFFENQNGSWKCIIMTNVDVQEQVASVRLTFVNGEDELSSEFYDADVKTLTVPTVSAPEGKEFIGWFREHVDENGKKTMDQVFAPSEDGNITLADDYTLEPMTLYALFEDAETETEGDK